MKEPVFSIIMCTKNSATTLKTAVTSVIAQTVSDWELLILDNGSEDDSWDMIQQYMIEDSRIRGLRLKKNIGWAKGASYCLQKANGQYMTFLAADDFFLTTESLSIVWQQIIEEQPDLIWIGHKEVYLDQSGYHVKAQVEPEYKVYNEDNTDKITEVYEIMNHLYYNSFFHFEKVDFLRKSGIDFFEPFYADYEGMTEAMCVSEKSVVLDQSLYALTINTSQTRNVSGWRENHQQWNSIMKTVINKGYYDRTRIGYIAVRILHNCVGTMDSVCSGGRVRDLEMNEIVKSPIERFVHLEHELESAEWSMMLYYSQNYDFNFTSRLLICAKKAYESCLLNGISPEEIRRHIHWLYLYVECLYEWNGESLILRNVYPLQCFEMFRKAIGHERNRFGFGFECINGMVNQIDQYSERICKDIIESYAKSQCRIIENLLDTANQIMRLRKTDEYELMKQECIELYQSIQNNLSSDQSEKLKNKLLL